MRQLWLDNEILDENGVRNYMSNAKHTQEGARLRNATAPKNTAQQDVDVMGSFQVRRDTVFKQREKKVRNLQRMLRHSQAILRNHVLYHSSSSMAFQ